MFSVRIVNVDHYLTSPLQGLDITYSHFRGSQVNQVPVIRIFGSTTKGEKTCLHVHGIFPYLLIPYDGSEDIQKLMYIIASSLDKAINISLGNSNSVRQHVFKIIPVSGRPFYGYHEIEHQFLKIFFYNPNIVKRATDLLQNGAICNKVFQPHEAHVPFILQFFIDYNLYGMSFIHLSNVFHRSNLDVNSENIKSDFESPLKISRCEIEVDAFATDIQNILEISDSPGVNPGIAAIWEEEKQRTKANISVMYLSESQPRISIQPTLSEILLKERLQKALSLEDKYDFMKSSHKLDVSYPLETQDKYSLLSASTVNSHFITKNDTNTPRNVLDESVIDENLILSLISSDETIMLTSQDQSLINILHNLAEETNECIEQQTQANLDCGNVEDDSILGSQLQVSIDEQDDLLVDDHETFKEELPIHSTQKQEENYSWDDNFDCDFPQIDGAEDLLDEIIEDTNNQSNTFIKTQKIENVDFNEDSHSETDVNHIMSEMWDVNSHTADGKYVECCDEVFYYSKQSENLYESDLFENSDTIKIDVENNLDSVLIGDPSFMSQAVASSDDASLYMWKENLSLNNSISNTLESSESDDFLSKFNDPLKLEDIKKTEFSSLIESELQLNIPDKNFGDNFVPLLNISECEDYVDNTQPFYCSEILDRCILNEDTKLEDLEQNDVTRIETFSETTRKCAKIEEKKIQSKGYKKDQFRLMKIKFEFLKKDECRKSKSTLYLSKENDYDFTEESITKYFKKLKKLKRLGTILKKECEQRKVKTKNKQVKKSVDYLLKMYNIKECYVLIKKLDLNSNLYCFGKRENNSSPKKVINELETLSSRPFSTELLNLSVKSKKKMKKQNKIYSSNTEKEKCCDTKITDKGLNSLSGKDSKKNNKEISFQVKKEVEKKVQGIKVGNTFDNKSKKRCKIESEKYHKSTKRRKENYNDINQNNCSNQFKTELQSFNTDVKVINREEKYNSKKSQHNKNKIQLIQNLNEGQAYKSKLKRCEEFKTKVSDKIFKNQKHSRRKNQTEEGEDNKNKVKKTPKKLKSQNQIYIKKQRDQNKGIRKKDMFLDVSKTKMNKKEEIAIKSPTNKQNNMAKVVLPNSSRNTNSILGSTRVKNCGNMNLHRIKNNFEPTEISPYKSHPEKVLAIKKLKHDKPQTCKQRLGYVSSDVKANVDILENTNFIQCNKNKSKNNKPQYHDKINSVKKTNIERIRTSPVYRLKTSSKVNITLENRKESKIKKENYFPSLQFLDGVVDSLSSSSDDGEEELFKLKSKPNVKPETPKNKGQSCKGTPTRRYKKLNIKIQKSPKSKTRLDKFNLHASYVKLEKNSDIDELSSASGKMMKSKLPVSLENKNLSSCKKTLYVADEQIPSCSSAPMPPLLLYSKESETNSVLKCKLDLKFKSVNSSEQSCELNKEIAKIKENRERNDVFKSRIVLTRCDERVPANNVRLRNSPVTGIQKKLTENLVMPTVSTHQ